jgi:CPA1 family monovalent cation:H+ antiporter
LAKHYAHRLAGVAAPQSKDSDSAAEPYVRYLELSLDLLKVERQTALGLRNEGRIPDEVSREMEHEFDLNEIRLRVAVQRAHEGDEELPHPQPE